MERVTEHDWLQHGYGAWDLIAQGHLQQAYEMLSESLAHLPPNAPMLMNRGICQLAMGDLPGALEDFRSSVRHRYTVEPGDPMVGVAMWSLGRQTDAVDEWRRACDALYSDFGLGIQAPALLFFAATRLEDRDLAREAVKRLRKRWKPRLAQVFPGVIAGYLLGKVTEQTFLHDQTYLNSILEARRQTRAHFWVGMMHLRSGRGEDYQRYLRLALKDEGNAELSAVMLQNEFWLAKAELALNNEGAK